MIYIKLRSVIIMLGALVAYFVGETHMYALIAVPMIAVGYCAGME